MSGARPRFLIGVVGTHTDVGKTYVSARWLESLRRIGFAVAARKPVQSYDPQAASTDAAILAGATGEDADVVCPPRRCYPMALAPPMAADLLRRPRIRLRELAAEIAWSEAIDVGVVETVGGPRSPLAHDGDSVDLLALLQVDRLLLIADAGLGTINAVRLALESIKPADAFVFLNRYDEANELHRLNREWLARDYGVQAAVTLSELAALVPFQPR